MAPMKVLKTAMKAQTPKGKAKSKASRTAAAAQDAEETTAPKVKTELSSPTDPLLSSFASYFEKRR